MIKFCKYCFEHPESNSVGDNGYKPFLYDNDYECPACGNKLKDIDISAEDYMTIVEVSGDIEFIQSMIELQKNDIVEYQLKINQFRIQQEQKAAIEEQRRQSNIPRCPQCGSTAITTGQRGFSAFFGFIDSDKTVNRCGNCGYKWEP